MFAGIITVEEAAVRLGVTGSRVRQLILEGCLPAQKVGTLLLIAPKDLARLQQQRSKRKRKKQPCEQAA